MKHWFFRLTLSQKSSRNVDDYISWWSESGVLWIYLQNVQCCGSSGLKTTAINYNQTGLISHFEVQQQRALLTFTKTDKNNGLQSETQSDRWFFNFWLMCQGMFVIMANRFQHFHLVVSRTHKECHGKLSQIQSLKPFEECKLMLKYN